MMVAPMVSNATSVVVSTASIIFLRTELRTRRKIFDGTQAVVLAVKCSSAAYVPPEPVIQRRRNADLRFPVRIDHVFILAIRAFGRKGQIRTNAMASFEYAQAKKLRAMRSVIAALST